MAKLEEVTLTIDGVEYEVVIPEGLDGQVGTVDIKMAGDLGTRITALLVEVMNEDEVPDGNPV